MEGLSAFIQTFADLVSPLMDFIRWAFPVKIYKLHDGERGVIKTFGKVRRKRAERGSGITVCFAFEEMDKVQAIGGFIDLSEQTVWTKDNNVIIMNGAIFYEVFNVQKAILETEDLEKLIEGICLNDIREHARVNKLDDILESNKLTTGLSTKVNRKIKRHGCRVSQVAITDLRPHEVTMVCEMVTGLADKYLSRFLDVLSSQGK